MLKLVTFKVNISILYSKSDFKLGTLMYTIVMNGCINFRKDCKKMRFVKHPLYNFFYFV